jgi:hypothetical protein
VAALEQLVDRVRGSDGPWYMAGVLVLLGERQYVTHGLRLGYPSGPGQLGGQPAGNRVGRHDAGVPAVVIDRQLGVVKESHVLERCADRLVRAD